MRIDESGVEWVTMTHPDTQGETETTPVAFEEIWKERGWVLKDDAPTDPGVTAMPVATSVDPTGMSPTQKEDPHA